MAEAEADLRAFFEAAGIAQYADALIEAGYDSLLNVRALDEAGLQELKAAVSMKTGHLAFLRTKIASSATTSAPPKMAAPTAATAAPAAAQQAAKKRPPRQVVQYIPASGEEQAAMHSKFEVKYSLPKYGNTLDTYTSPKNGQVLCTFIGTSTTGLHLWKSIHTIHPKNDV